MFPASGTTSLSTAWSQVTQIAANIKAVATTLNSSTAISRQQVLNFANSLADALSRLTTYAATPGLPAYAINQLNTPTLDIAAEYTTMRTQIVSLQDWIVTNFPKDASNNLVVFSFDANKRFTDIFLTEAQLGAFKTQLSALVATIN